MIGCEFFLLQASAAVPFPPRKVGWLRKALCPTGGDREATSRCGPNSVKCYPIVVLVGFKAILTNRGNFPPFFYASTPFAPAQRGLAQGRRRISSAIITQWNNYTSYCLSAVLFINVTRSVVSLIILIPNVLGFF